METIKLSNEFAALELVPEMGGGIARLDVAREDGAMLPVLRPWSGNPKDGPFALACNILVPFSNRISMVALLIKVSIIPYCQIWMEKSFQSMVTAFKYHGM